MPAHTSWAIKCRYAIPAKGTSTHELQRPRTGEFHGCPFRDLPKEQLATYLQQYNLTGKLSIREWEAHLASAFQQEEVQEFKGKHEYQLACRAVFERLHPGEDSGEVGISPLNFYTASRRWAPPKSQYSR